MHYKESLKPIFFLKKSSVHYNLEGFNTLFVVVIIEDKEILRGSQYSVKMFACANAIDWNLMLHPNQGLDIYLMSKC